MFENPRRGRQARDFTKNVPKILVLKSSSEQIFSRKLPLGAPEEKYCVFRENIVHRILNIWINNLNFYYFLQFTVGKPEL